MQASARVACLLAASSLCLARANSKVHSRLGDLQEAHVSQVLDAELEAAAGAGSQRMQEMRQFLSSIYVSLPKNAAGKLDRKVVRYALHRFFAQRNGWFVRGLEPTRGSERADAEHHTSKDLTEWIPLYLQDLFEAHQRAEGVDLDGLAVLAAALDGIVRSEAHARLEMAYSLQNLNRDSRIERAAAEEAISTWYVEYQRQGELEYRLLADVPSEQIQLADKQMMMKDVISTWEADWEWIQGLITRAGGEPQDGKLFNFDAVARVVDAITDTYHTRNDPICEDLKATLLRMESAKAGRVRLADFHRHIKGSMWRFGESKEYLRSLGALDDSEPSRPYVIIENYATSRTNCFAPSDVYVVCCRSSCEELMGEVEAGLGAASATPSDIVAIISSLPSSMEAPRRLSAELLTRLSQVAELHGGHVPLHGRLFAQWMHHAYPRECPYPHQEGGVNPRTPSEWLNETGQSTQASEEELLRREAEDGCVVDATGNVDCDESETLPWDVTEELFTSHGVHAPSAVPAGRAWLRPLRRACMVAVACLSYIFLLVQLRGASEARRSMRLAAQPPRSIFGLLIVAAYVGGLLNFGLVLCMLACGCAATGFRKVAARSGEGCGEQCSGVDKVV